MRYTLKYNHSCTQSPLHLHLRPHCDERSKTVSSPLHLHLRPHCDERSKNFFTSLRDGTHQPQPEADLPATKANTASRSSTKHKVSQTTYRTLCYTRLNKGRGPTFPTTCSCTRLVQEQVGKVETRLYNTTRRGVEWCVQHSYNTTTGRL